MASTRSHQWALTARWNLVEVKKSIFLFNHSDGWQLVHAARCTLTTHHVVGYNSTQAHIKHQPSNTTPVTLIPEEDWRWELALSLYTHTSSTSPFNFDVVFFSQIHPTPSTRADWVPYSDTSKWTRWWHNNNQIAEHVEWPWFTTVWPRSLLPSELGNHVWTDRGTW